MVKYGRIFPLVYINNNAVSFFEGEKEYFSTGSVNGEADIAEIVTYDTKPSRANVQPFINDILFAKMKSTSKTILINEHLARNIYSTGFFSIRSPLFYPKYLFYLISNDEFEKEKDSFCFGTTQFAINQRGFKKIRINYIVNKDAQYLISDYLDNKIEKIDELIHVQEDAIGKLEEYKQSVINETVINGLKLNIEMKDTGISWIGSIPIRYKTIKLNRGILNMKDGTHGSFRRVSNGEFLLSAKNLGESSLVISENESMISEEDYNEICKSGFPKQGDVLLTIVGTIGRSIVYKNEKPFAFQRSVLFLRTNELFDENYLSYSLKSTYMITEMMNRAKTSAQSGIYGKDVRELKVVLPPMNEQRQIVYYLDRLTHEINQLIQIKKDKIEKLNEYKKSLIYEAVTGKIEVM